MVCQMKGTVSRILIVAKNCLTRDCVLHIHPVVYQKFPQNLDNVLKEAIKNINFVKKSLLINTAVRWLSLG